jgi:hypothetical protein
MHGSLCAKLRVSCCEFFQRSGQTAANLVLPDAPGIRCFTLKPELVRPLPLLSTYIPGSAAQSVIVH